MNEQSKSMGNTLPETGFLRLKQIIGDRKSDPPVPAMVPVGKYTWWAGVKSGWFPKAIKLTERTTVWRVRHSLIHNDTAKIFKL